MNDFIKTIFLIIAGLALCSCDYLGAERGNGNILTEERRITEFNKIEVEGNFQIELNYSSNPGISIQTDENLHQYIEIEVEDKTLHIDTEKKIIGSDGIKVFVDYVNLQSVDISGAATLNSEQPIKGDYFGVDMSGAGNLELILDVKALKIEVSGAGAVKLSGSAQEQNISMSGAGGYDGYQLHSKKCRIDISGAGGANVYVTEDLKATISGVGGINYRGNPDNVDTDISGLGKIIDKGNNN